MSERTQFIVPNLAAAVEERLFPTVTAWNPLEGRPRTANFNRALKAEVHDALWMLTRQWQLAEFKGDDAGSPISPKISLFPFPFPNSLPPPPSPPQTYRTPL